MSGRVLWTTSSTGVVRTHTSLRPISRTSCTIASSLASQASGSTCLAPRDKPLQIRAVLNGDAVTQYEQAGQAHPLNIPRQNVRGNRRACAADVLRHADVRVRYLIRARVAA